MDPDVHYMLRLQQGDRSAFEALFRKYYTPVFRFCLRILRDTHEAEDAAQDIFLQLFRTASRYRPDTRFTTYLFTIARNRCLNRIRDAHRCPLHESEEITALESPQILGQVTEPGPDQHLIRKEMVQALQEAIQSLPPSLRLPLILRRYHDLSCEEIAQILDCSVNAVKIRLYRARRALIVRLERRGLL